MIAIYARTSPEDVLTRVGRKYATLDKACSKARTLAAFEVEIRDESLPRSRSLKTIFIQGEEVAPTAH